MNKIIFSIIVVTTAAFLSGCGGNMSSFSTDESEVTYDCNRSLIQPGSKTAETKNTVYFITGTMDTARDAMIMYVDKATGSSGVLCNRPDCLHDGPDCNAYIGIAPSAYGIASYGGKLCWVQEDTNRDGAVTGISLYSMNFDSTGRKRERVLEPGENCTGAADRTILFHRGYVCCFGTATFVEDGELKAQNYVTAYTVNEDRKKEVFKGDMLPADQVREKLDVQAYQDNLYIAQYVTAPNGMGTAVTLSRWNMETDQTEEVFSENVSFPPLSFWVTDEGILFTEQASAEGSIHFFDFGKKAFEERMKLTESDTVPKSFGITEDRFISYWYPDPSDYGKRSVLVTDHSGKVLLEKSEEEPLFSKAGNGFPYVRTFLGADDEQVYYYFYDLMSPEKEQDKEACVVSISIRTGEQEVLWTSKGK